MHLLPRQLRKDYYEYYADVSEQDFRDSMDDILERSKKMSFQSNITGEFLSYSEFILKPKAHVDGGNATIKGKLEAVNAGKTKISFTVSSSLLLAVFFYLGIIIGIACIFSYGFYDGSPGLCIFGFISMILLPLFYAWVGSFTKDNMKNRLVQIFGLYVDGNV